MVVLIHDASILHLTRFAHYLHQTAHSIHHLPAIESPKVSPQCGIIAQGH
jgi:hypothetical protein